MRRRRGGKKRRIKTRGRVEEEPGREKIGKTERKDGRAEEKRETGRRNDLNIKQKPEEGKELRLSEAVKY